MSDDTDERDEAAWAAERRDFVADWRDTVAGRRELEADGREGAADQRDLEADLRESELDALEQRLRDRAAELGDASHRNGAEREQTAARRSEAHRSRAASAVERGQRADARQAASEQRTDAGEQRALTSPTMLAAAFAELARHLYQAEDFDDVMSRIVAATVSTVEGCDMASVTIRDDAAYRTVATTDDAAMRSDEAQYAAGEGPCLDAVDETLVYAPEFPDPRWPALDDEPKQSGVESVVSLRLTSSADTPHVPLAGSLNVYSGTPDAFDIDAQQIGLVLAAHASVAAGAARERESLQNLSRNLHEALNSRDVIGQAKGILMERLHLAPDDAFDVLRRASQQLNIKLRDVAARVAYTGDLPKPKR